MTSRLIAIAGLVCAGLLAASPARAQAATDPGVLVFDAGASRFAPAQVGLEWLKPVGYLRNEGSIAVMAGGGIAWLRLTQPCLCVVSSAFAVAPYAQLGLALLDENFSGLDIRGRAFGNEAHGWQVDGGLSIGWTWRVRIFGGYGAIRGTGANRALAARGATFGVTVGALAGLR